MPVASSSSTMMHIGRRGPVRIVREPEAGGPPSGLLDPYASVLNGVYSVCRRLISSYEGPAIRVRYGPETTETDVYFLPDGSINMTELAGYAAAFGDDVYLVHIYNQLTDGEVLPSISQTSAFNQGRISIGGVLQLGEDGRLCCTQTQYASNMEMNYSRSDGAWTVGGVVKGRAEAGSNGMFSISSYSIGAYPVGNSGTAKGIFVGAWIEGGAAALTRTAISFRSNPANSLLTLFANGMNEVVYSEWNGPTAWSTPIFGAGGAPGGQCCENFQEFWVALSYLDDATNYMIVEAMQAS